MSRTFYGSFIFGLGVVNCTALPEENDEWLESIEDKKERDPTMSNAFDNHGDSAIDEIHDLIGASAINNGEGWPQGDFDGDGEINGGDQWIAGDFNNDRRTDLFWWKSAGVSRMYLSNPDGTFRPLFDPIEHPAIIDEGDEWSTGDFNGDGRTDLYLLFAM